jgi:hypothetical protein
MLDSMETASEPILKPGRHPHLGHECFFPGCPFAACRKAQRNAELYGFNGAGEIKSAPRKSLPWEDAA